MYRLRTCIFTLGSAVWLACSAGQSGDDDANAVPAYGGNAGPAQAAPNATGTNFSNPVGSAPQGTPSTSGATPSGSQSNEMQPGNAPIAAGTPTGSGSGMSSGGSSGTSTMNGAMAGMNAAGAGGAGNAPPSGAAGGATMPPVTTPPATPPPATTPPVTPPPVAPVNCGSQFLCEDFEGVAAGASPNAAIWTLFDNYSPRATSANVQVSAQLAHGGKQALHVTASSGRSGIVATLPQSSYFMRAWLNIDAAPLGPVFIGLGTDQNSETRLRIQGRSFATINTVGPGDAVRPNEANSGNCTSCVTLTPNRWFCAEMSIDNAGQNATLWIDGTEAASIANGQGGWPVQPAQPKLFVGSMGVQGGMAGVYVDDVAAGPTRIGCN